MGEHTGQLFPGFTYSIIKYSFQAEKVAFPYIIRSHEAGAIARLHARQCDKENNNDYTSSIYIRTGNQSSKKPEREFPAALCGPAQGILCCQTLFDVTVSLLVIVGILSWLTPLLGC